MSSSTDLRRMVADASAGSGAAFCRVGSHTIHHYWPLLASSFRGILLAPHRRVGEDGALWSWREPEEGRVMTPADLALVRQRLAEAHEIFLDSFDHDGPVNDDGGVPFELRFAIEDVVTWLNTCDDRRLAAYVCRTEAGWFIHSWGVTPPAVPRPVSDGAGKDSASTPDVGVPQRGSSAAAARAARRRRGILAFAVLFALGFALLGGRWLWRRGPGSARLGSGVASSVGPAGANKGAATTTATRSTAPSSFGINGGNATTLTPTPATSAPPGPRSAQDAAVPYGSVEWEAGNASESLPASSPWRSPGHTAGDTSRFKEGARRPVTARGASFAEGARSAREGTDTSHRLSIAASLRDAQPEPRESPEAGNGALAQPADETSAVPAPAAGGRMERTETSRSSPTGSEPSGFPASTLTADEAGASLGATPRARPRRDGSLASLAQSSDVGAVAAASGETSGAARNSPAGAGTAGGGAGSGASSGGAGGAGEPASSKVNSTNANPVAGNVTPGGASGAVGQAGGAVGSASVGGAGAGHGSSSRDASSESPKTPNGSDAASADGDDAVAESDEKKAEPFAEANAFESVHPRLSIEPSLLPAEGVDSWLGHGARWTEIAISVPQLRLLRDVILPTEPVVEANDVASSIVRLRELVWRQREAEIPPALARPKLWHGCSIELSLASPAIADELQWTATVTTEDAVSTIQGTRAEVAWRAEAFTEPAVFVVHNRAGRAVARVEVNAAGEWVVRTIARVRAWPWLAIETVPDEDATIANRLSWRGGAGLLPPSANPRGDEGRLRVDLAPNASAGEGSSTESVVLEDSVSGWALSIDVVKTVGEAGATPATER